MVSSLLVVLALAFASSASIGPETDLFIVNKDVAPDGFRRSAVLAGPTPEGATLPGPLITGFKGDTFKINVIDLLEDPTMERSTSIHWHGLFQKGSNWADGVADVTQCPIAPGHSFRYHFRVPDQAGTFWYHSHLSTQYCDGLRGPLVIYDRDDPHAHLYDIDDESTVITLVDWYHTVAPSAGRRPFTNSTLINGYGRLDNGTTPLAVINVEQGKRYRFRLINMACDPNWTFYIDHHDMTVIEVDGENHQPLNVDSIQIFAAQRYSFILNADQPVDNYWIRANPNAESGAPVDFLNGINSAILRYKGAPHAHPSTSSERRKHLKETDLVPLDSPQAPGGRSPPDLAINLGIFLNMSAGIFTINDAHFERPRLPILLQILSRSQDPNLLLPAGSVYTLPRNAVVELSIPGGSTGTPHPFHLHGHSFSVVRAAGSDVYNYDNPPRRDVVSIGGPADNVTIRFKTDNPGPWFFHCHIDWHLEMGLAVVFAEEPAELQNQQAPPPEWDELCKIYDALPREEL